MHNHSADPPAFPSGANRDPGMTLRDWFAGQALAGERASETPDMCWGDDRAALADSCYADADAMLKAREAPGDGPT